MAADVHGEQPLEAPPAEAPVSGGMSVDRSSPVPLYVQIRESMRADLARGRWKTGDVLPCESELCRIFGVSRVVIRQALHDLRGAGLVTRERGRGTFAAKPKISEALVQRLTGMFEDMTAKGHRINSRVLRQEVVAADELVANRLGIEPGARVIQIDRLRLVDGEPLTLVSAFLPLDLCAAVLDQDLAGGSLYAVLKEKCGLSMAHSHRTLEAVAADRESAELLGVAVGAPLMKLESLSSLADGRPVEHYQALHRSDRARFEVELTLPGG
jgi:GntR family transcriptional regulator